MPTPTPTSTPRLVVDASTLLALALGPGPRADAIAAHVAASDLHAPALLPFEIANVLRRQRLAGRLERTEAEQLERALARLPIELWPHEVVADRVRELGDVLTAYDGSYVALAEHLDATLLTTDRRLAAAPGLRCAVVIPDPHSAPSPA